MKYSGKSPERGDRVALLGKELGNPTGGLQPFMSLFLELSCKEVPESPERWTTSGNLRLLHGKDLLVNGLRNTIIEHR